MAASGLTEKRKSTFLELRLLLVLHMRRIIHDNQRPGIPGKT